MKNNPTSEPTPIVTKPEKSLADRYAELLALREKVREAEGARNV
jgi:hypothetical protein